MNNLIFLGIAIIGIWWIASTGSQVLDGTRRFQNPFDKNQERQNECFGIKNGKITLIPCSEAFRDD